MKKLYLIIAAMVLASSFAGCNENKVAETTAVTTAEEITVAITDAETKATDTAVQTETAAVTTEYKRPEFNTSKFNTTVEDFKKTFESLIDPSLYDASTSDKYISYYLKYESSKQTNYNFDNTVKLYDGKTITLPTSYKDISTFGWTTRYKPEQFISGGVQTGIDYKNASGEEVILWTVGNAALEECTYHELQIDIYKLTSDIDGKNVTRYYKKNPSMKFILNNGITEESSMEDVIKAVGTPKTASFMESDNTIRLSYIKTENDISHSAAFTFSADSGKMIKIEIS